MAKRSLKASSIGIAKAKRAFERREWTQEYLASAVGLQTRQSVWKFFSGRPIERHLFIDLCFQLDLDWQEIADLPSWDDLEEDLNAPGAPSCPNATPKIKDQNWQWLQEKLYDRIQRHCSTPETMFNCEKTPLLEQVYVEQSFLPFPSCQRWIEATELQRLLGRYPSDPHCFASPKVVPFGSEDSQRDIQSLLAESPRLLINGKPGSGKTTLLQFLALQQVTNQAAVARVPLFIPLRQIAGELDQFPLQSIETLLFQYCQETGITLSSFQHILSEGKILLLLDGLDELTHNDRNRISVGIQAFVEAYPNTSIVITCRSSVPDIYYREFRSVEVADFSDRQIACFAQKWFTDLDPKHQERGQKSAQRFFEQLSQPQNKRLQDFAKSPLLLSVLCWVFQEQKQFPKQKSLLYHTILELLLSRWDRLRNIDREAACIPLDLADYMTLLSHIAGLRFEAGQYVFEKKDILAVIFDYLMQLPDVSLTYEALWLESEAVLKMLTINTGVLVEQAYGVYSFCHLALQEYLTARYVLAQTHSKTSLTATESSSWRYSELLHSLAQKLQHSRWKTQHPFYDLARHVFDSRWHEVILLTLDLSSNSELLLELLKQQVDRSVQLNANLRSFFQWLEQKTAEFSSSSYSLSALRAFYCGYRQGLGLDLAMKLDDRMRTELSPKLSLEATLFQILYNLDQFLKAPALKQAQHISSMLNLQHPLLEPSLYTAFKQAREVFQTVEHQSNHLEQWCQTQGVSWAEHLKDTLMKAYDLGYEWELTAEQYCQLESYYWANVFLVDCLHQANSLSGESQTTFKAKMLSLRELRRVDFKVLSSRAV